ncbi:MAG TPA: GGDEF domain-containing protein [Terracidiphilus sp.]|nr:GGDEF domain-containing protein [Terracidiphilus sp.]
MLDWTKLPDLAAVALLTCAFASVARREQTQFSGLWLTGWVMIALHFASFMFLSAPGNWGILAGDIGLAALTSAGVLFMHASVPYRKQPSSKVMFYALLGANALYVCMANASPVPNWALDGAAVVVGALPLAIALMSLRTVHHPLRWIIVVLYCALSVFILSVQHRNPNGGDVALNAVLFTVYFGCALHFWYSYRRATAGAFITIAGFFAWASVFVVGPLMMTLLPNMHVESEVWNLPKYVVAVGMILLLLEDQIAHNKYLALHDELTGLPNRRLFLDRLGASLERSRRTGSKTALLVVDLDQFKQVNDSLGHHAGDLLLQQVGTIFTGRVRLTDTVARTGGDEFSIILEDAGSAGSANQVAQFLLQLLNEPLKIEEQSVWVGGSIGVAVFPDDASDIESLCIAADLRMYAKKNDAKQAAVRSAARSAPPRTLDDPLMMRLRTVSEQPTR